MNLNLTIPSLLIVIVGSFISVVFFTEIYTEIFSILLLALFFLSLTIIKLKRFFVSKKFIVTIFIFLILILYNLINRNNGVIYDVSYEYYSSIGYNIYHTFIIYLCTFIIGYFYSLQFEYPLNLFSKIISIQLITFFVYLLTLIYYGIISSKVNLATGRNIFIFIPYFLIAFNLQNKKLLILLYIVLISYLILISNRGIILAVTMFFISYSLYPFLCKKINLFKTYFFINLFLIFLIFISYLAMLDNDLLIHISRELFDKRLDTRGFIWLELIDIIRQKYLFGYGSDQVSSYITYEGTRNRDSLSSHNLFLEIILTGGLLGLFIFLLLIYSIFTQLYSYSLNHWGRIGSSLVIGLLYAGQSSSDFVQGNVIPNIMIFLLIATALGQVVKSNRSYMKNKINQIS